VSFIHHLSRSSKFTASSHEECKAQAEQEMRIFMEGWVWRAQCWSAAVTEKSQVDIDFFQHQAGYIKKLLCHPEYQIARFWNFNAPISYQFASLNNASNYHHAWVLIFDNTHLVLCKRVSFWNIISCFIFYSQWTKHAIVNYFLVLSLSLILGKQLRCCERVAVRSSSHMCDH
jgi:hypothetical protein